MDCGFYFFHDKVDFSVNADFSAFKFNDFSFTYHGLTFDGFYVSYGVYSSSEFVKHPYMMCMHPVNQPSIYRLCFDTCIYIFTLDDEVSLSFDKWLGQFPVCIDLD